MKKDVKLKPGISVIDEVPIIPTHAMLEDRDLPEQHPIDAIEGLTDALSGIAETEQTLREDVDDLADAVEGEGGLSDRMETAEGNITANAGAIQDLDSSAVHKSGAETISGAKTFSGSVEASGGLAVRNASAPAIGLYKGSAEAGSVGASGTQIGISAGGVFLGIKDTAGTPYAVAPTAGEGVTDADAIVTRSGLASDTRVVHTTGGETISGAKTFKSKIVRSGVMEPDINFVSTRLASSNNPKGFIRFYDQVDSADSELAELRAGSTGNYNYSSIRVYNADRSAFRLIAVRAYPDYGLITADEYYPVDADENPVPLINAAVELSGNIAVDPRIVHATGAETIAGAKTFTSAVSSGGGFRWGFNLITVPASDWMRVYTFEPPSSSMALRVLIQTIRAEAMIQTMLDAIEIYVSTGLNMNGSIRSNSGIEAKLALNTAGKIELWIHRATGTGTMKLYCNFVQARGYRGATAESVTGSEPTAGADYTTVITLGAVV